ncbi:radical SAM protein [Patescibacteria group bacterium]
MDPKIRLLRFSDRIQGIMKGKLLAPVLADVDPVSGSCNLDCEWCAQRDSREAKIPLFMSVDTMKKLGPFCRKWGVKAWRMAGDSEPTLNQNIHVLFKSGHDNGIDMGLITNGTLLNKVKNLNYLTWIGISLDAATAKTWSRLKGSPEKNFHKIMDNVRYIRKNFPNVEITFKFTRWSNKLHLGRKDFSSKKKILKKNDNYDDAKLLPALAKKMNVNYFIHDALPKKPKYQFDVCRGVSLYATFGADHKFYLCCDRRNYYILTNDYTRNNWRELYKLWGSPKHKKLIASINPKKCPFCSKAWLNTIMENIILDGKYTKGYQVNFI